MLDKIKEFFRINGGIYTEICRQIEELENQGKDERYLQAELAYRKLQHDMMWSSNNALQHELDNQELLKIGEIVQEGIKVEEARKEKLLGLKAKKNQLEQEILKFKKEKERLESKPKGLHDDLIDNLQYRIRTKLYEIQRDKTFILNKVNELDTQISELQYKHDLCTKKDMIKLEIAAEIAQLKIKKDSIVLNEYIPETKRFDAAMEDVEKWRYEITALQSNSDSTKLEGIKNMLSELIGG